MCLGGGHCFGDFEFWLQSKMVIQQKYYVRGFYQKLPVTDLF